MKVYVVIDRDQDPVTVTDSPETALRWARGRRRLIGDYSGLILSPQGPDNGEAWWLIEDPQQGDYVYGVLPFDLLTAE